jgi:hypothetical protein
VFDKSTRMLITTYSGERISIRAAIRRANKVKKLEKEAALKAAQKP